MTPCLDDVSQIDWVRLAAYIDGEGHIGITFQKARGRAVSKLHFLRVSVCNTDPKLVQWLKDTFGGTVVRSSGHSKSGRYIFSWFCGNARGAELLKYALPYFIIKRDQAKVAIEFQDTITTRNRGTKVPPEVVEQREAFRLSLSALKRQNFNSAVIQ